LQNSVSLKSERTKLKKSKNQSFFWGAWGPGRPTQAVRFSKGAATAICTLGFTHLVHKTPHGGCAWPSAQANGGFTKPHLLGFFSLLAKNSRSVVIGDLPDPMRVMMVLVYGPPHPVLNEFRVIQE